MFQTDLIANFLDGSTMYFSDVHPDNVYKIENGLLTFEDTNGEKIHYLPVENLKNFYTICVEVHD
jgi:hypothetical protein